MANTEDKKNYVVASGRSRKELEKEVNELIDQGYFPHGSMSIIFQPSDGENFIQPSAQLFQPMILPRS